MVQDQQPKIWNIDFIFEHDVFLRSCKINLNRKKGPWWQELPGRVPAHWLLLHEKSLVVDGAGVCQDLLPASSWNSSDSILLWVPSVHTSEGRHRALLLQTKAFSSHVQVLYPQNLQVGPSAGLENKIHHLSRTVLEEFQMTESVMLTLIPLRSLFKVV